MTSPLSRSLIGLAAVIACSCTKGDAGGGATTAPGGLSGTAWRLESLSGAQALDGVEATLEFPEPGKVTGKASCNRFFGSVQISGSSMLFSAIGATKVACDDPLNRQEAAYLGALQVAERFELDSTTLRIYSTGSTGPLTFVRQSATLTGHDPTGMWTVVGHRAPGVSGMSTAQAETWTGRTLQYGIAEAIAGADTCMAPSYQHRSVAADSLLSIDFRITPTALGLPTSGELRLGLTKVTCEGKPWMALGGLLLQTADDHAFAVQDGVFFELKRTSP
ncbi:MAG: META domain-containing protein [Gemmatimonadota bacterium]